MKIAFSIAIAVVFGVVVTLLTGLINTTPNGLVGATWYGYPLNWINKLITYPIAWKVQYTGLVVDLLFWIVIGLIIMMIVKAASSKGKKRK